MKKERNTVNKAQAVARYLVSCGAIAALAAFTLTIKKSDVWFSVFSLLIIATAIAQRFALKEYFRLPDLGCLFLILTYMFHFGVIVNMGIFKFFKPVDNIYYAYGMQFEPFKRTAFYCLASVMFLGLGMLLAAKKRTPLAHRPKRLSPRFGALGWILTIAGAPFYARELITSIAAYLGGAYGSTFGVVGDGSGIFSYLCNLFYMGVACLITYYARFNRRKSKNILMLTCFIQICFILFTGGRGVKLLIMAVLLLLGYYNRLFKLTRLRVAAMCLLGFVGIVVMNTIADVRSFEHGDYLTEFFHAFGKNFNLNAIFDILQETGGSIYTPYLCLTQRGTVYSLAYGKTYLLSFSAIIPNVGGIITEYVNGANFVKSLIAITPGGSFIGEAYFNFGYFGAAFCGVIGVFVCKVSQSFYKLSQSENPVLVVWLIPIASQMLWWSRDLFLGFPRSLVWGYIIVFVVWSVSKLFVGKKNPKIPPHNVGKRKAVKKTT